MEFLSLVEDWKGFTPVKEVNKDENYEQKLAETINLLSNSGRLPAHRYEYLLREAMTTSDFPLLFGDTIDRQMLAAYKATEPVWKKFTKVSTVRDFREAKRFKMSGGDNYLAEVAEKGEYPASSRDEAQYTIRVKKYGRQFDISLEAIINDDLGALRDTPERFALAAQRTEERIITGLYANDIGSHGAGNLYENGVNATTDVLSIGALEDAIEAMAGFTSGGEPILNRPKYLVVPPSLEFTARQILTSATKMWVDGAAAGAIAYPTTNVIANYGLELVVDYYLPILGGENGKTAWYLFADPKDIVVLEAAYLRGHENPEICMKASDKVTVGGGAISPFEGDFTSDNIVYRVRHIFGGAKVDWKGTYCSTGVGS